MDKKNITIENARLCFRNFSGEAGTYNPEGRKNFCVLLDDDMASYLRKDGWNVKELKPRDEDDKPQPYLQVAVNFDNYPPNIFLVTIKGKNRLDADSVNILDWAEIEKVDLIIRPREWEMNGNSGVKAYLKTMYVTIVEDELEEKYSDYPDSAKNLVGGCGKCEACEGHGICNHEEE